MDNSICWFMQEYVWRQEKNLIRKGAVSAKKGEKLLIPINMRDG